MNRFGKRLISLILKYPLPVIILIGLFTATALFFIPKLKLENTVDSFWDKKSESYMHLEAWKDQFGDDQFIIFTFGDNEIFTEENLKLISRLTEKFESLEHVSKVTSLANVNDIIGHENDFIVRHFMEEIPTSARALQELKKRALTNPLYVKNLISEDSKTAAIMVELENPPGGEGAGKKEAMQNIQKIAKKEFRKGRPYYISGPTPLEFYYHLYIQRDLRMLIPLFFLIIGAVVFFSLRNVAGLMLSLLVITISVIWTMFFLYSCGFLINGITSIVPIIISGLAVAGSIHVITKCLEKKKSLKEIIEHLALPCLLASLTTAVGFLSLTVSKLTPVRELGLVAGAGVLFAFIITFTLIPALIKQFGIFSLPCDRHETFDKSMMNLSNFNEKYKTRVLAVTAIFVILSFWGISKIKVDTSLLEFFKKTSPFYKSTNFIEKNLSGIHFLEISLKGDRIDYFKEPGALRSVERLQDFLTALPEVDKTTSPVDYIKEINKSFHSENGDFYEIPSSRRLISQYLLLYGATDLYDFVDSRWEWLTVQTRLTEHSTSRLKKVIGRIEDYLDKNLPPSLNGEVLGMPIMEVESNETMTRGQAQSLGLAMLIIFSIMFVLFRSLPVGLISIVPNALPILFNFGLMGFMGIRLDSATTMISAVCIGIIVDDTIHFLHCFREEIGKDADHTRAVHRVLLIKGRPIVLTSTILFFAFAIFIFGNFMPIVHFGILCALMMLTALFSDLIVLPSFLLHFRPKFR
jgi:predicted RND superfamily exporter protein